jgi:hypothetical protein
MVTRLTRAWRRLAPEGRMAAGAALLLFLTMFLPWYQLNAVVSSRTGGRLFGDSMNAFAVFSFVEAAVLLVAVAVLVLLFARAEGRAFHLPGGDGTIVTIAGGWTALLLVWRLFDKPDVDGGGVGNVGIQWGIFFALGAAGLLAYAGVRMRAAHRPEPGGAGDVGPEERAARRRRPRPAPGTEMTRPLPAEPASRRAAEEPTAATRALPADMPTWEEPPTQRPPSPPPPPPSAAPARVEDPPTERIPAEDPPTERMPPAEAPPPRRRARPPLQGEEPQTRLWDDR